MIAVASFGVSPSESAGCSFWLTVSIIRSRAASRGCELFADLGFGGDGAGVDEGDVDAGLPLPPHDRGPEGDGFPGVVGHVF